MKFAALDCRLPSILYTNNIHKLNVQHFRFLRSLAFKSRPTQFQKKCLCVLYWRETEETKTNIANSSGKPKSVKLVSC